MTTHIPPTPVHTDRIRISTTVSQRTHAALANLSHVWDDLPVGRVLDRLLTERTSSHDERENTAERGTV